MHNDMDSIEVEKILYKHAVGSWHYVGDGHGTYEFHYGFQESSYERTSRGLQADFSGEMSAGIDHEGPGVSKSCNASVGL